MSKARRGHKAKPKVPLSKRNLNTPSRKFPIKGHTKSRKYDTRNGDSSVINGTDTEPDYKEDREHGRGGDTGGLLTSKDPREVKKDLKLVERAVRNGWGIKRKNMIVRRLQAIVEKTHVSVATKTGGTVEVDGPADSNAIAAARVLVAMNGQDQADDHLAIKNGQPDNGSSTTINIHNNVTNIEQRRIELARLADKFGARSLVINGEQVSVTEYLGSTGTISEPEE